MDKILKKVNKFLKNEKNIEISKACFCEKTRDYIFMFDYKNGEEYQSILVINPDTSKEEKINVFKFCVDNYENNISEENYKEICI